MFLKDTKVFFSCFLLGVSILALVPLQSAFSETEYRVRYSDSLGKVINKFYPKGELTRQQIMVSVFRENPDAFADNNIHLLLRNRTLVLPNESDLEPPSVEEAKAVLLGKDTGGLDGSAKQKQAALREDMEVGRRKQEEKIRRLERESSALKIRLEQLIEAKNKRDAQLTALEDAIEKSSEQPVVSFSTEGMSKEVIQRVQNFKAENETLKSFRIDLSKFTANIIASSMNLLGITVPERM